MEKEQNSETKWEAKVSTVLKEATADQIWALYRDFFNFHKWFPDLASCYGIHGINGEPGCIRYCGGFSIKSEEGENSVSWSKEKLTAVDPIERSLTYEIVDCNIGFKSYVSTVKITPCGSDSESGCEIDWWINVDPVKGWVMEDLVQKFEVGLARVARRMEEALTNLEE